MSKRKRLALKTLVEVGSFFGLSQRTIRDWFDDGCPCKGGPYDLYQIVEWWARERKHGSGEKSLDAELKRRRLEQQLKSEQLDYAERIDELMPRVDVELILNTTAVKLQKAGELLKRQFGDDAQLVILEALDSVDHVLSQQFKRG